MTSSFAQLEVAVVSGADIASKLDGVSPEYHSQLSASSVRASELSTELDTVDCLLVDQETVDSWRGVVDDVTDARPALPVVVLVTEKFASAVGTALETGANDYLPRPLCENQPSVVAMQLATLAARTETPEFEQMYRDLFENVSDGIVVHDPDSGKILDCNEQFCKLTGYSRTELVGETIDLISAAEEGDSSEKAKGYIREAQTDGPQLFEWHNEHKSGEQFYSEVHLSVAQMYGDAYVIASVRDITARKHHKRDFEQIFNGVNDIVEVYHPDTAELLQVNDTLQEVTGYDRETIFEMGAEELTVATDEFSPEQLQQRIDRVMAGEDVDPYERTIRTVDGDCRLEVNPTRAVIDGEPRFLAIARDVTARRERQRRLETERDQRSVLFENNPDPVLRLEFVEGKPVIREVNAAFEHVFGFDSAAVVGSTVGGVLVPDDERERYERLREQVTNGEAIEEEATRLTADGNRQFVFKVIQTEMAAAASTDAYVWYRDVTERQRQARAIRSLQDATVQMQRADNAWKIAHIAGESADRALGLPEAVCWLHDESTGNLVPVAATAVDTDLEQVPSLTPTDYEYEIFESGQVEWHRPTDRKTAVSTDTLSTDATLFVPLGKHGLLAAGRSGKCTLDDIVLDVARTLAEQTATALDRVTRAREVRRNERRLQAILDRIDEAIFMAPVSELTTAHPAPDYVSSGYEDIWGLSLQAVHEQYEDGFFATLHPDDVDGYRTFLNGLVADVDEDRADERYTTEYRIERPTGQVAWVQSDFYLMPWEDDTPRVIIVSRDITERKERQRTLESFHDATAELTTVDTVEAASRLAVEAATEVLDIPATAVYQYDEETATLSPIATGPKIPNTGDLAPLSADNTAVWDAFVGEQLCRLDAEAVPAVAVSLGSEVLLVPLGSNGLLVVWSFNGQFDTDAASILAATLEAALNRLRGEQRLESRRDELAAQTERARRLDAVAELTQRVEAAITTNSSRTGIQQAVCTELTDMEPFVGAFIAAAEVGTDRLTLRAVAGIDRDTVEKILPDSTSLDSHPATEAWKNRGPSVVNDLVGTGRKTDWRRALLRCGAGAVCAVPISYNDVTYGVLTIVADDPNEFGEREIDVLSQLGTSIGYAITAVERQRALESDDTLELELAGGQTEMQFAELARKTKSRVRHERTVRRQDGSVKVYYTVLDDSEHIISEARTLFPGELAVVTQTDGETLLERQGSTWFGSVISEYGGILRRGYASSDSVTLVVEIPRETNTRVFVERLQDEYPSLELTAQRQHHDTASTASEIQNRLQQRLTARQYEAIETGYAMGYFDWPRESSGEEVADRLGITQPTVNKHIRLGERKVFDLLFGSD